MQLQGAMKILLCYSRPHFDPTLPKEQHRLWGSSASVLARTFHRLLSEFGEVTYVDPSEVQDVRGRSFDLFVGGASSFRAFLRACRIDRSIFVAVNRHPRERNRLLLRGLKELKVPARAVAPWEFKRARKETAGINLADVILCAGNEATIDSFVRHGVDRRRIKRFNYGLLELEPSRPGPRSPGKKRLVYAASEIGLRKGFDLVDGLVRSALGDGQDFRLDIVGEVSTPHYRLRLQRLVKESKGRVHWHGWLDSSSERYATLMHEADFLLFPSLEEGQAGTVLDGMARGAIPLITDRCGFDFAPLGYLEPRRGVRANHLLLRRALELDEAAVERLRQATLSYYREYHASFESALQRVLARFVSEGQLYPKISVVLPVFNKERSVRSLLTYLDAALESYPSRDLQVILDGCQDASEQVARQFFRLKHSYPVTFDVTPNIFEVMSNNLGLRRGSGEICAIVQDDNYLYDKNLFFEAADLFELSSNVAVMGGLAGVNFYPRGFRPEGTGQIAFTAQESYWRQDEQTDASLKRRLFEVDACMRGPLFIRKTFLEKKGYLDEAYAPLYMDDMDLCFRARADGWKVVGALMEVENRCLTMANYSEERNKLFEVIWKRNTDLFYSRYTPSCDKSGHAWLHRHHIPSVDLGLSAARKAKTGLRLGWKLFKHGALKIVNRARIRF
jgi:glycosyltransferase involved in cell wall biosynthesis/GT2 family glycosyltransferase